MMTMTKKELAKELGYEYLGKGVDSYGDEILLIYEGAATNFKLRQPFLNSFSYHFRKIHF